MPLSPSPSPALGGERGERIGQEARHPPGKHQPTSHQRAWTTIPPNHLLLLIGELSSSLLPPGTLLHRGQGRRHACLQPQRASDAWAWGGRPPRYSATSWMPASVSVGCDVPVAAVAATARQWQRCSNGPGHGTAMEQWPLIVRAGADAQASGGATWCCPRYPEDSSATWEIIESNHIWEILN
ncbi:hypothetical protein PVAP13_2NG587000 [Panicum virgatum]|uniref:Uncharacterized protein n=1 Tax=Panicum virgatum TaxID=38727 RepID=A0A8T0VXF1_PANVG|nr:hypothetical protein PVAP13_2NG587000 [Panicum virgatum]